MKKLMIAALAVFALASCNKGNDEVGKTPEGKGDAKLSVELTLPVNPATRAVTRAGAGEQDATAVENDIKSVTVYIFKTGGAAATGSFAQFVKTDFTPDGTNPNKHKLNSNITTDAGNANIYVAINLPSTFNKAYDTEGALKAAIVELADIDNTTTTTGFTMISEAKATALKVYDAANAAATTTNETLTIDRVVSKVVTSSVDPSYDVQWSNGGPKFTYTMVNYRVYNEAIKSNLVKAAATNSTLNLFANARTAKTILSGDLAKDDAALTGGAGIYIGENSPATPTWGNSTYAMISTTIVVDKAAVWNNKAGAEAAYEYKDVTGGYGFGKTTTSVWVVIDGSDYYVTDDATKAANLKKYICADKATVKIIEYKEGYVHFRVLLNEAASCSVPRNQFVHVKIKSVKLMDGKFTGYPGGEDPIDPNEEPEESNPDPTDPDKPVVPEAAQLNVEITVSPWYYSLNETDLQ